MGAYVCEQGLHYSPFDMVSQCHPPVKGNKTCYIIYKKNVLSF
jgi:hypothetical protein